MRRRRWLLGTISSRCSLFASVLILLSPICSPSSENDRAALLQFKSGVSSDPAGLLSVWRDSAGSDHCSWPGVSCDARSRVSAVNISGDNGGGDRLHDSSLPAPLRRRCSDPAARLAGRLSPAVGRLSELKMLALPCHSFDGEIPGEIWGLQNLEVFDLHGNSLSGVLPSRMPEGLRVLNLAFNRIRGEVPSSLSRCLNLEMVDLSGNHINGAVPPFFAHLPKLRVLSLSFNRLRGSVPGEIGNGCRSLEHLDLSGNLLVGEIPAGLGNCRQLRSLLLFSNLLGGLLPPEIGRLTKLQLLDVSRNRLSGLVPEELGNCVELSVLVLSNPYRPTAAGGGRGDDSNHFGGGIPESVTGLSKLRVLWAPRSKLKGRIPSNWGACERLQVLNLAENLFTGNIPAGLERCKNLEYLNLSSNFLTGGLKEGLPLHSMNVFDVSGNRLSGGPVPRFSSNFLCSSDKFPVVGNHRLSSAYCSFFASSSSSSSSSSSGSDQFTVIRRLTGRPPSLPIVAGQLKEQANSAFMATPLNVRRIALGSPQLYNTTPPEVSPENSRRFLSSIEIASVASAAAIVAVLLGLVVLYVYTRNCAAPRAAAAAAGSSGNRELTLFTDIGVPLTYELVVRAAGNFNASNCIGSGGFGATYKAEISPGVVVAIKRLSIGRFHGVQQFQAEIKTLGRWRHPNLVTLIGFHVSEAEMFLIYNFLPGGNLEKFIQARRNTAADWRRLHRIALDVAQALAYLHDDCSPRILHRDVKPSNILLDRELNAYLSDFGLARLLGSSETHATTGVAGTFGYVAPEYAMTCRVSDKADVYSYGVVLLELLSDKKALDPSFSQYGNGFNIVAWGSMLLQRGKAREFFADGLWDAAPHDDLVETLHLAVMCTLDSMSTRPTMKQVVHRLKQLRPPAPPPSPPYMS